MLRAALYERVSTEDQATDGYSLDAQDARLRAHCVAQGWTVAKVYRDEGHSGRTPNRPEYQRMMNEPDEWDVVVVLKMDRIHRNSRNMMAMMEGLQKQGKEFASVTESLDTGSAMGRFVLDIIARIAQLESEVIGERAYGGMEQKAKSGGGSLGGPAPHGYEYEAGKLVIDPKRVKDVEFMFDLAQRISVPQIAVVLNNRGWVTKNHKPWTRHSVRRILTNPAYAGCTVWNGILQEGTHEPIVSMDLFNKVQARIGASPVVV